jgi:hypothetical protein
VETQLSVSPSVSDSSVEVQKMSASQDPEPLDNDADRGALRLLWKEYTGAAEPDYFGFWGGLEFYFRDKYPSTFKYYVTKYRIAWSKFCDHQMRKHSDPFRRFFLFSIT